MSEWFYLKGSEKSGPVSSEELRQLAISGTLERADRVWKEGMADWVSASSVKGLFPAQPPPVKAASTPPPVTTTPPPAMRMAGSPISLKASPLVWGLRAATALVLISALLPWWNMSAEGHVHTNFGAMGSFGGADMPQDINADESASASVNLFSASGGLGAFIWIVGIAVIALSFFEGRLPHIGLIVPAASVILLVLVVSAMLFSAPSMAGGYSGGNEFGQASAKSSAGMSWGAWVGLIFSLAVVGQAIIVNLKAISSLTKKSPAAVPVEI